MSKNMLKNALEDTIFRIEQSSQYIDIEFEQHKTAVHRIISSKNRNRSQALR